MKLTCIVCPIGCRLTATRAEDAVTVTGNRCPRGAAFAKAELTAPMRSVTTTVRTAFAHRPVLPVRTRGEIPKALVPALMGALAQVEVTGPLAPGDVVLENALDTGCDVVATDVLDLPKAPAPSGE